MSKPASASGPGVEVGRRMGPASEEAGQLDAARAREVLEERARLLARAPREEKQGGEALEVVAFRLAGERYALPTRSVREVLRLSELTPLPGAPDFVAGVINLRGEILPVFDLRRLFELPAAAWQEASRLLVLGSERAELGILAEAADEVLALREAEIHAVPPSAGPIDRRWIRGLTRDLLVLLDGEVLLRDPRLFVDTGDGDTGP